MARANTGSASSFLVASVSPVVTATPFTVAGWVYPADAFTQMNLCFTGRSDASAYWNLAISQSGNAGKVAATVDVGGASSGYSASTFSGDVWNHVGGVYASSTSRTAYLNGAAGTTDTTSVSAPAAPQVTSLGAYYNGSSGFSPLNGRMAEFGVWDVALTAAEMLSLSKGVSPLLVRPNNLIAYWPLSGVGSPEPNRVSLNHLTVFGSMAKADHPPRLIAPALPILGRGVSGGPGPIGGTLSVVIDAVTISASADLIVGGSLGVTVDPVTLSANGNLVLASGSGSFGVTIEPVVLTSNADLIIQGQAAPTIDPVTLVAAGAVTQPAITGTFGVTIGPVTLAAYQTVPPAGSGQRDSDPVPRRPVQPRRKGRVFHILVDRLKTEVKKPGPLRKKRKKLAKLIAEEAAEAVGGLLAPAEAELEKEVRHDLEAVPLTELHTEGWSELQDRLMQVIAEAEETAQQLRAEQEEEDDLVLLLAS